MVNYELIPQRHLNICSKNRKQTVGLKKEQSSGQMRYFQLQIDMTNAEEREVHKYLLSGPVIGLW